MGGSVPDVAELTIDSGARLDLDAGSGVGVTLEYLGDGHWALTTLCDTRASGATCVFDIQVSSDESETGISSFEAVELEPDDSVTAPDDFALQLDFETGADLDTVAFDTTPGATVRVSALLYDPDEFSWAEWSDDPRLLSWIGHGALEQGAPTNPVDLTPDQP